MSWIDDYIQSAFNAQKAQFVGELEAKKSEVQNYANEVQAAATQLDTNFQGFMTGALPPAFKTSNANVLVRDPSASGGALAGYDVQVLPKRESNTMSIGMVLVGGFLVYFLFFKRRRT